MAQTVYTALLYAGVPVTGTSDGPGPPVGFRWVLTDIQATPELDVTVPIIGLVVRDDLPVIIQSWEGPVAVGGRTYQWSGRQVIDNPGHLTFVAGEPWIVRITGFLLSLP